MTTTTTTTISARTLGPAAVALCALLLAGCSHDFLDREPLGSYTFSNFWETPAQLEQALIPGYATVRGLYSGAVWQLGEYRSDNTTFTQNPDDNGAANLWDDDIFVSGANVNGADGLWNSCYGGISDMNLLLDNIDAVEFPSADEPRREVIRAEARFLRGMFYHLLTLNFGDVPLLLTPEFSEAELLAIRRAPVDQVYEQAIVPDLTAAIDGLPEAWPPAEVGRATSHAARVALAKAHFARRDYAAALPPLTDVIESERFELLPDFRSVFAPDRSNNREIIFAGQYDAGAGQGANFFFNWLPLGSGTEVSEGTVDAGVRAGINRPTRELYGAYDEDDPRRDATIGVYLRGGDTILYPRKYIFPPIDGGSDLDIVIFRYGDVLLMYAEALLESSSGDVPDEAFNAVNAIRARAGLPLAFPFNPDPELDLRTPEDFRRFLRSERRRELAIESSRWYDLVRYGTVVEAMQAHGERLAEYQPYVRDFPGAFQTIPELFPIPLQQVLQYGYRQNPGY